MSVRLAQLIGIVLLLLGALMLFALPSFYAASSAPVELWRDGRLVASYARIQEGIDAAEPGDRIQIAGGVYHENLKVHGKRADANHPFVMEAARGETVVVDGADPGLQELDNGRWQWDDAEQAWVATVPWSGRPSRSLLTWASYDDGRLIASHHNREHFLKGARGDALWRTGETVRLRLKGGGDPNHLPLNIGTSEAIVQFDESSGWILRNINLRHAGFAGVHLAGSDVRDITLEQLMIEDSFRGISTEDYGGGGPSENIQIQSCRILNNWDFSWAWKEGYRDAGSPSSDEAAPMRGSGIHLRAKNAKVSHCEVAGQWDGMQVQGINVTLDRNIIHHIKDDMIELESNNSRNVQVYENVGFDLFAGLSVVANRGGPIYIYRNFVQSNLLSRMYDNVWRYGYPLKFGNDWGPGAENIYIYQNTFDSQGRSMFVARRSHPEKWRNIEWVNNIFNRTDAGPVGIEGMGEPAQGLRWEGNLYTNQAELDKLRQYAEVYAVNGHVGGPALIALNQSPPDLRIGEASAAVGIGSSRPTERGWPDSMDDATSERPDVGARPLGSEALHAGPNLPLYSPWSAKDPAPKGEGVPVATQIRDFNN